MPPCYIRVRAVVWAYGRGQTDTPTHRRAWPQYILCHPRLTQNVITAYFNMSDKINVNWKYKDTEMYTQEHKDWEVLQSVVEQRGSGVNRHSVQLNRKYWQFLTLQPEMDLLAWHLSVHCTAVLVQVGLLDPECLHGLEVDVLDQSYQKDPTATLFLPWCPKHLQTAYHY